MASIDLGDADGVSKLFSYPNNFNEVGYLAQTIEKTIGTWVSASLKRDGFTDSAIAVTSGGGRIAADISGSAAASYADFLPKFLNAGKLALAGGVAVNADKKWIYNWRFLLPLGLAMIRHRSVQLLHFPPDYVLERDQDYLASHTTQRWAELLVENGALAAETDLYQTVVDIAPVAAPSDAGAALAGIYPNYHDYIVSLLTLWLPTPAGSRPMVAFGGPVRDWLKTNYSLNLPVLTCGVLKLDATISAPVLAANHPSFIYNALKDSMTTPGTTGGPPAPTPDQLARIMRIMQQDLVAAGWQVQMAATPKADPQAVLKACADTWSQPGKRQRICELSYTQVFNKTPDQAKALCANLPPLQVNLLAAAMKSHPMDDQIEQLRQKIGALESREPDKIHWEG